MKKVLSAMLVLAAVLVAQSSGVTIFETFDENVITNGSWTYTQTIGADGKDAGNVSYVGGTTSGYVTYNVARDDDATTRLSKSITAITTLGNLTAYLEYDFQVLANNSGSAYSLVGLFNGNNGDSAYQTMSVRPRSSVSTYGAVLNSTVIVPGVASTENDGTYGPEWVAGTNYRVKIKFTGHKDGPYPYTTGTMRLYMDADIYTLVGNTETLISDGAEFRIFKQASSFNLNSIGFGNNNGLRDGSANFAIDNFYFSTDSANVNTVAPSFIPEPTTIAILSLGALLIRRK